MAVLLRLLINKHGQKKGDRHPYKCRAYASGSKKNIIKAKEAKMREEEVAAKSRNIQVSIYSASEIQRRHFCETCKRTKNRNM